MINGYAMMKVNTLCFPITETVAPEIIHDIPYVAFITVRSMRGTGRTVKNAVKISKRKCMFGTAQMSSILKN